MFCNLIGAANSLAMEVNMQFENYQAASSPMGTRLDTYQFGASWYPSKVKDGIGVGSQL